jgi:hypothetical protein
MKQSSKLWLMKSLTDAFSHLRFSPWTLTSQKQLILLLQKRICLIKPKVVAAGKQHLIFCKLYATTTEI